jgi:hypothetical protein
LLLLPGLLAVAPEDQLLERAGLILPTLFHTALVSLVCAATSVGISALSKSRALTMSAWMIVLIVPQVLAAIVHGISGWPWLYLLSIPKLLGAVADGVFRVEGELAIEWYHAAPVLVVLVAASLFTAYRRISRAEVIT